jgi:threonyl-tRNA synthetase
MGDKIRITLPDGSAREYDKGISALEVIKSIGPGLAKASVAARVDDKPVDLSFRIEHDAAFSAVKSDTPEGLEILRHSASHLMAQAVTELYPGTRVAIGPAIEDGFYYDFDRETPFTTEDLEKIENKMTELAALDIHIERREMERDQALEHFRKLGESYKVELITELPEGQPISFYGQGSFVDLCRGPHLPSTGRLKHFKLLSVAGAYWRGSERNKMLQRIYGTAFDKKEQLEAYLSKLEEIKKRDHRRLGRELDLFSIHEEVGGGLVHWHPKGAAMRDIIEAFWKQEHRKRGYQLAVTPHIASEEIYRRSGHLQNYSDLMYSAMDIDGRPFRAKPMNCPGHILIYKTRLHSYREMPYRIGEMGTVYRYERSGVLHGLLRVRGFTIDDAHIFCRPDQLEAEVLGVYDFATFLLGAFGFKDLKVYLATRPEKSVGADADWEKATYALRAALEHHGVAYEVDEGGGAFYGPKIDLKVLDPLGREWQCTTIQFDFNLPERFDITYVDEAGKPVRPFVVHRALLGSLERFFALLVEHYAGNFPLWLAPVQVAILTITDAQTKFAQEVAARLEGQGLRVKRNLGGEKIGAKIRDAEMEKIPYMVILGKKEEEEKSVSVRRHGQGPFDKLRAGDLGRMGVEELAERLKRECEERA